MEEGKENKMECPECKEDVCPVCGKVHGYGFGFGHCWKCHHNCWRHGGHWFLRLILGLIILLFVFSAGVKLGELKSQLYYGNDGGYFSGGLRSMMRGGQLMPDSGYYYYGPGMMNLYGRNYEAPTSTAK